MHHILGWIVCILGPVPFPFSVDVDSFWKRQSVSHGLVDSKDVAVTQHKHSKSYAVPERLCSLGPLSGAGGEIGFPMDTVRFVGRAALILDKIPESIKIIKVSQDKFHPLLSESVKAEKYRVLKCRVFAVAHRWDPTTPKSSWSLRVCCVFPGVMRRHCFSTTWALTRSFD